MLRAYVCIHVVPQERSDQREPPTLQSLFTWTQKLLISHRDRTLLSLFFSPLTFETPRGDDW